MIACILIPRFELTLAAGGPAALADLRAGAPPAQSCASDRRR
jgi:hypothetical protein